MKNFELIPNKSYGIFVIGDNIIKYLYLPYNIAHIYDECLSFDEYDFYDGRIEVWTTRDNKIDTIRCSIECHWQNLDLIGILYENFLALVNQQPNKEEILYVPVTLNRGQNQKVYTFYDLGLQIWVWRGRIKTVLISKYEEEERVT